MLAGFICFQPRSAVARGLCYLGRCRLVLKRCSISGAVGWCLHVVLFQVRSAGVLISTNLHPRGDVGSMDSAHSRVRDRVNGAATKALLKNTESNESSRKGKGTCGTQGHAISQKQPTRTEEDCSPYFIHYVEMLPLTTIHLATIHASFTLRPSSSVGRLIPSNSLTPRCFMQYLVQHKPETSAEILSCWRFLPNESGFESDLCFYG